jgi:hypothetical protein
MGTRIRLCPHENRRRTTLRWAILAILVSLSTTVSSGSSDLRADATLLQSSPDLHLTQDFYLNVRPGLLESIVKSPMLIAHLWQAHNFSPQYKVRPSGEAIHVDDPTGIQGDVYLVESLGLRSVWVGYGNLNHALVPSFAGQMALVLKAKPEGSGISARVDLFIRTNSRLLGIFTSAFYPLLRARVERRVHDNAGDFRTIVEEINSEPEKAVSRLGREDAADLTKLLQGVTPRVAGR